MKKLLDINSTEFIRLQEQVRTIQSNDLKHLAEDINDVKMDVKEVKENVKEVHDKVDALSQKVAYYAGGLFVIMMIIQYAIKASSK